MPAAERETAAGSSKPGRRQAKYADNVARRAETLSKDRCGDRLAHFHSWPDTGLRRARSRGPPAWVHTIWSSF